MDSKKNNTAETVTPMWQVWAFYISSLLAFTLHPMYTYSLVIYSRHITQSDALTGLVFMLICAPFALFSLVGGTVCDRYSRKWIILIASTLAALFVGFVALIINRGAISGASYGLLFLSAAVYGSIVPFMATARYAMVGNVLTPAKLGVGSILFSIISVIGYGLGPLIAGAIKETASWEWLFGFNAGGWLLSGLGYLLVTKATAQARSDAVSHYENFKQGFKFIVSHKLFLQLGFSMTIVAFFILGPYQALMPEQLNQAFELGEKQRGYFMSIFGAGLLVGGLLATALRKRERTGLILIIVSIAIGCSFALVPVSDSYLPALICLLVSGVLGGISNGLVSALMQEEAPDNMRGRVMSLYSFVVNGMPALGGLVISLVATGSSVAESIIVAGVSAALLSIILGVFAKRLRLHGKQVEFPPVKSEEKVDRPIPAISKETEYS